MKLKRVFRLLWNSGLPVKNAFEAAFYGVMSIVGIIVIPALQLSPAVAGGCAAALGVHISLGYVYTLFLSIFAAYVCIVAYLVPLSRYLRPRSGLLLI